MDQTVKYLLNQIDDYIKLEVNYDRLNMLKASKFILQVACEYIIFSTILEFLIDNYDLELEIDQKPNWNIITISSSIEMNEEMDDYFISSYKKLQKTIGNVKKIITISSSYFKTYLGLYNELKFYSILSKYVLRYGKNDKIKLEQIIAFDRILNISIKSLLDILKGKSLHNAILGCIE